jgi:hypothetical protein
MTRAMKREIKAAYRDIHALFKVSDADVFAAYVGSFKSDRDYVLWHESECDTDADTLAEIMSRETFDANGMWQLGHADMAHGIDRLDGHYFWRNP